MDANSEAFCWLRTALGAILFAYFTLSSFSKKIGKSTQRRPKKVLFLIIKIDPWVPRVDGFGNFDGFRAVPGAAGTHCDYFLGGSGKKQIFDKFPDGQTTPRNPKKSDIWRGTGEHFYSRGGEVYSRGPLTHP